MLTTVLVLGFAHGASAACQDPERAAGLERTSELAERLNTYAEGARLCIKATMPNQDIKPGYYHNCSRGRWVAEPGYPCADSKPAKQAKTPAFPPGQNSASTQLPLAGGSGTAPVARPDAGSGGACATLKNYNASAALMSRDPAAWAALNARCGQ